MRLDSHDGAIIGKAFSVIARVSPVYGRLPGAKFSFEEGLEIRSVACLNDQCTQMFQEEMRLFSHNKGM